MHNTQLVIDISRYGKPIHNTISYGDQFVRNLTVADIPNLLELESRKWEDDQSASAEMMYSRIMAYPDLCTGAFSREDGSILASSFLKPSSRESVLTGQNWAEMAEINPSPADRDMRYLFGISLSSSDKHAVYNMYRYIVPHLVRCGYKSIFLGSPVPGLREWISKYPGKDIEKDYIFKKRNNLPVDPQLRYYHLRGFNRIVSFKKDYFPHYKAMDCGAVLECTLPFSYVYPIGQMVPLKRLHRFDEYLCRQLGR